MQFQNFFCFQVSPDFPGMLQLLPFATATVTIYGEDTLASLYDIDGTPIDNPVTADATGVAGFAADDGAYAIQIKDTNGVGTFLFPKVLFSDSATNPSFQSVSLTGADPSGDTGAINKGYASKRMGALIYKGTWDASTNTPTLTSATAPATGVVGWYYRVSVAGTTALDGISTWNVGDFVWFDGSHWQRMEANPANTYAPIATTRTKLLGDTTYYVRTDGSDSNTGLADTSGGAFLTIGKALSTVFALDANGHTVTILVRAGTYAENVNVVQPFIGGSLVIQGDTTTPSNVVISPASGIAFNVQNAGSNIAVGGFKLVSANVQCLSVIASNVTISGAMEYGSCGSAAAQINLIKARLTISSNYTISGGGGFHLNALQQSTLAFSAAVTVTVSGTPAFGTAFVRLQSQSFLDLFSTSTVFSGSATGVKYIADDTSDIYTSDAAVTQFYDPNDKLPGSITGYMRQRFDGFRALRNRLLNGNGGVQFGPSGTCADHTYGLHNRWYALTQSGSITPTTLTDVEDGTPFMIRLTNSFASAQRCGYAQIIEGKNCKSLRNKYVTLSARVRLSTNSNIKIAILEWTGTEDGTATVDIVNNWASSTFTPGNFFASSNLLVDAVGSLACSANTLTNITVSAQLGGTFNNLIVFIWQLQTLDNGDTLDFVAQLEAGSFPTRFEHRLRELEESMCRRYYQAKTVQSQNGSRHIPLAPKMRIVPTVAVGVGSAAHITQDGFELTHTTQADCTVTASAEL